MAIDLTVIIAAIVTAGTAIGAAIRFIGKRFIKAYDERTAADREQTEALVAMREQLAVFAEASRETNSLLRDVLREVTKLRASMSRHDDITPQNETIAIVGGKRP